jgi:uncharacterized protein YjiS (DUF1127 family)
MSSLADRVAALRRDLPASARGSIFTVIWDQLVAWQRNRRSRIELSRMSPRELRDIGLSPAESETECNKPFWTG